MVLYIARCGFVDDLDIIQTGLDGDDYWEVVNKLQEALTWWEICSKVSGGALVPSKSWYGLVDFEWNNGEWSYKETLEGEQVSITDLNRQYTQL